MNARDPVGPFPSNPGDWYEAKEREARELSEQLRQAKERGASEATQTHDEALQTMALRFIRDVSHGHAKERS